MTAKPLQLTVAILAGTLLSVFAANLFLRRDRGTVDRGQRADAQTPAWSFTDFIMMATGHELTHEINKPARAQMGLMEADIQTCRLMVQEPHG